VTHRGIRFVIRARPGPNQWVWTIYPKNAPARSMCRSDNPSSSSATTRARSTCSIGFVRPDCLAGASFQLGLEWLSAIAADAARLLDVHLKPCASAGT
jgi:hypothetical protein